MFAESPGLNAVEHPIFDVWLTGCAKPSPPPRHRPPRPAAQPADGTEDGTRRRVRR